MTVLSGVHRAGELEHVDRVTPWNTAIIVPVARRGVLGARRGELSGDAALPRRASRHALGARATSADARRGVASQAIAGALIVALTAYINLVKKPADEAPLKEPVSAKRLDGTAESKEGEKVVLEVADF